MSSDSDEDRPLAQLKRPAPKPQLSPADGSESDSDVPLAQKAKAAGGHHARLEQLHACWTAGPRFLHLHLHWLRRLDWGSILAPVPDSTSHPPAARSRG